MKVHVDLIVRAELRGPAAERDKALNALKVKGYEVKYSGGLPSSIPFGAGEYHIIAERAMEQHDLLPHATGELP